MPKQNRKRKHLQKTDDEPKPKLRPSNDDEENFDIFDGPAGFLKCLEEAEQEPGPSCANVDSGVGEDDSYDSDSDNRKPAWFDEEDDGIEVGQALNAQKRKLPKGGINDRKNQYTALLKHKFTSVVGKPQWASLDGKRSGDASDSDEEILQTCGFINKRATNNLPENVLEFKKVKDLNCETYNEGPYVNSVEFHPSSSVALVAGNGAVASLIAVDGRRNNKLHSVAFERFPIICAKFINNGNEAVFGSRHSHIFSYDLLAAKPIRINLPHGLTQFKKFVVSPDSSYIASAGKWGEVHILTAKTKERVTVLKQDSEVTSLTFNPQGNLLYGHSDTGEVTVWDMNMRRVKHKFTDEGCLQGSALALSSSNQFLATGSAQGVVNLYGVEDVLQNKLPKPRKTIMNLTTAIKNLQFNSTSDILALTSVDIPNSVKLFHLGAGGIFQNFPTYSTKLGHINVANFSPGSGFLALGNTKSTVALFRLKHFKNY